LVEEIVAVRAESARVLHELGEDLGVLVLDLVETHLHVLDHLEQLNGVLLEFSSFHHVS